MKPMSFLFRSSVLQLAVSVLLLFFSASTLACTAQNWASGGTGLVEANGPGNSVARVSGLCGLKVTGLGDVQDNNPAGDANFIGRFYFLPQFTGTGAVDLFVAYSDEGATQEVFSVSYDGTDIIIDSTASAGNSASFPAESGKWNLVEFMWSSGNSGSLWVNSDAVIDPADGTFDSGTGAIQSVKLGAPNGFGGSLDGSVTFDDYVSKRWLDPNPPVPVGGLLLGDTNNDGTVNVFDISATLLEIDFFDPVLQEGTPDCNKDGQVNVFDISATILAIDFFDPIPCGSN